MTKIEEIIYDVFERTEATDYEDIIQQCMSEYAEYCVSKERYLLKQQILDLTIELSVSEKIIEELQKLLKDD